MKTIKEIKVVYDNDTVDIFSKVNQKPPKIDQDFPPENIPNWYGKELGVNPKWEIKLGEKVLVYQNSDPNNKFEAHSIFFTDIVRMKDKFALTYSAKGNDNDYNLLRRNQCYAFSENPLKTPFEFQGRISDEFGGDAGTVIKDGDIYKLFFNSRQLPDEKIDDFHVVHLDEDFKVIPGTRKRIAGREDSQYGIVKIDGGYRSYERKWAKPSRHVEYSRLNENYERIEREREVKEFYDVYNSGAVKWNEDFDLLLGSGFTYDDKPSTFKPVFFDHKKNKTYPIKFTDTLYENPRNFAMVSPKILWIEGKSYIVTTEQPERHAALPLSVKNVTSIYLQEIIFKELDSDGESEPTTPTKNDEKFDKNGVPMPSLVKRLIDGKALIGYSINKELFNRYKCILEGEGVHKSKEDTDGSVAFRVPEGKYKCTVKARQKNGTWVTGKTKEITIN